MAMGEESGPKADHTERTLCHIWDRTSVKFSTLCGCEQLTECVTPDLAPTVSRDQLCPECLRIFNNG